MIDANLNGTLERRWIEDAARERIAKIKSPEDEARFAIDFRTRKASVTNGNSGEARGRALNWVEITWIYY